MTAPLLPVSKARAAGERLGLRSMIVLQELPDGRWGFTSWGKTRRDCQRAQGIAKDCLGAAICASAVIDEGEER